MLCNHASRDHLAMYVESAEVTLAGMSAYNFARLYQWRCGACGFTRNGLVDDASSAVVYRTCSACATRNRISMSR